MPVLISESRVELERADILRRVQLPHMFNSGGWIVPPARTPGLHLSGVICYVADQTRITDYVRDAAEEERLERGMLPLRWFIGMAWEEAAASLYPGMVWQPGEAADPVIMTPDGLSFDGQFGLVIEEFKLRRARRMTGADLLKKKQVWLWQGAGYCLGYGAEYVRWHVGDLMEFPDPTYTTYLVKFTSEDLAGMERMIETNWRAALEAGYGE